MRPIPFVSDWHVYRPLRGAVERCFDVNSRLPAQVLKHTPQKVRFFEFEEVFSVEFWHALKKLAINYHDDEINLLVVDPDAQSYFHQQLGYFGAFVFQVSIDEEEYISALTYEPIESPADSLLYNSNVITFIPPSSGYAVWAERELGIGILAVFDTQLNSAPTALPEEIEWFDARRALELITPSFSDGIIPQTLTRTLLTNFRG